MSETCLLLGAGTQEAEQSQSFLYPRYKVSLLDGVFPMKPLLRSRVIHSPLPLKSPNEPVTMELTPCPYQNVLTFYTHTCARLHMSETLNE